MDRIAIINEHKCKPKKCAHECMKKCPVNTQGKQCVDIEDIARISEALCTGCGMCAKVCPFGAIKIINLPTKLKQDIVFKYGENRFQLHRLPQLRKGQILGILGVNGIGKSTMLKLLSGQIRPNFGNWQKELDDKDILKQFRKSPTVKKYFENIDDIRMAIKRQDIDKFLKGSKNSSDTVTDVLDKTNEMSEERKEEVITDLELTKLLDYQIGNLSGGEFQRLMCAVTFLKEADLYVFDEPTSFLDVKQRLKVARMIRELLTNDKYIIVVEHDLSILDFLSDRVCLMYGEPGAYGVITQTYSTSRAINIFFNGYIPSENIRFRSEAYSFKRVNDAKLEDDNNLMYVYYDEQTVTYDNFKLTINPGKYLIQKGMTVLLGQNGTGKSTFLKTLAESQDFSVSFKSQDISMKKYRKLTVRQVLQRTIGGKLYDPTFKTIIRGFNIERLLDRVVRTLSGGEKQVVALTMCLGKDTDVYLIDEPSAFLDAEQRTNASNAIRRYIYGQDKSCFVVEHDILMATYLASEDYSQVIVFEEGEYDNGMRHSVASEPMNLVDGMNRFLEIMDITFKRDSTNHRPRINKYGSQKDREQRGIGKYFET